MGAMKEDFFLADSMVIDVKSKERIGEGD